jgi:hypothetical protein
MNSPPGRWNSFTPFLFPETRLLLYLYIASPEIDFMVLFCYYLRMTAENPTVTEGWTISAQTGTPEDPVDTVIGRLRVPPGKYANAYTGQINAFADLLEIEMLAHQQDPGHPIDLPLPQGVPLAPNIDETIAASLITPARRPFTINRSTHPGELPGGIREYITHPVSGSDLFLVITSALRPHHERYGSADFLPGLRYERRIVTRGKLPHTVQKHFQNAGGRR